MRQLVELYQYRDLLWLWTLREIRVRYKQSLLGVAWAILQPLAFTAIFSIVFSKFLAVDTADIPYPIFVYVALAPWTFFATSLGFGIPSLINNMNLVTKIYFPREVLPLASVGAAFLDLVAASLVLGGMLIWYRLWPTQYALWIIPLLLIQITLTIAVTLTGAVVIIFFRDMRFVVPLLTQVWMYATPITYPVDLVPPRFQFYYFLNPMASLIDGYRRVLLTGQPPRWPAVLVSAGVSLVLLLGSYIFFKWAEPTFADLI